MKSISTGWILALALLATRPCPASPDDEKTPDDNRPPEIVLSAPSAGSVFDLHAPIKIVVDGADPDGRIERVEFFANEVRIGEDRLVFIPGLRETFSMVWTNAPAGAHVLTARATDDQGGTTFTDPVRIEVYDPHALPRVFVHATDPVASEGPAANSEDAVGKPDTAAFTIHRTRNSGEPLTVFYRVSGAAQNGVDYAKLDGMAVIPADRWSVEVIVAPVDDDEVEGVEAVVIELEPVMCPAIWPPSPGCYMVGKPARAIAFIRDNDVAHNRPPKVAITSPLDYEVFEAPADVPIRAIGRDSDGWIAGVEFYDGRERIGGWTINFFQEPPPGLEQEFEFTWKDAPTGRHRLIAVVTDNLGRRGVSEPVQILVREPNDAPVVTIHTRDAEAREPAANHDGDTARLRVVRRGPGDEALNVHYALRGTATNGKDYETLPGHVTIPAGRRSAPIIIRPVADDIVERIETVIVRLLPAPELNIHPVLAPPSYQIGRPARAAAFIVDADHPRPDRVVLSDGSIALSLDGRDGVGYRIEASRDMEHWDVIDTRTAEDGRVVFVDPEPGEQRFYRLVEAVDILRSEDSLQ